MSERLSVPTMIALGLVLGVGGTVLAGCGNDGETTAEDLERAEAEYEAWASEVVWDLGVDEESTDGRFRGWYASVDMGGRLKVQPAIKGAGIDSDFELVLARPFDQGLLVDVFLRTQDDEANPYYRTLFPETAAQIDELIDAAVAADEDDGSLDAADFEQFGGRSFGN